MKKITNNYEVIKTEDGSYTLFSKVYNEACHSLAGASAETKLHYLKACEIENKIKTQQNVAILEVGFGTGLGFLETYELFKKHDACDKLKFISLEIDPDLVEYFYENHPAFRNQDCLEILVGDARNSVSHIKIKFDAIYQDAFSPRRNPILWTMEWFEKLGELSHEQTILSTYSASSTIRKSLLETGWRLHPGAKFGPKRSATIAKRTGESDSEILDKLERSPVKALTDEQVDEYRKRD